MKKKSTSQGQLAQQPAFDVLSHEIDVANAELVQLTPDGLFSARDGRPGTLEGYGHLQGWQVTPEIAEKVLQRMHALKGDIVVDYEHQTLNATENGKPAPAAGWITPQDIRYEPGKGIFAPIRWTKKAQEYIQDEEYRYISPVIEFDPETGDVLGFAHVALVNYPAIDGMKAIAALRAFYSALGGMSPSSQPLSQLSEFPNAPKQETPMDRAKLIMLLGLSEDATDADIEAAIQKLLDVKKDNAALRTDLGLNDGDDGKAAIAALKAKPSAQVDHSKYAPLAVVEDLRKEIVALKAGSDAAGLDKIIKDALDDGRLMPAEKEWAEDWGTADFAALKAHLDKRPAIAALKTLQTQDKKPPAASNEHGLSDDELEAARLTGRTPAEYAALKGEI